jgi:hypothetical protein
MKLLKSLLTRIWRWLVLNKDIISIKFALHGLSAEELPLAEQWLAAGLTIDEIVLIFKKRRLKKELRDLLKKAGFTDDQIKEIFKEFKEEIENSTSANDVLKQIKSKYAPK